MQTALILFFVLVGLTAVVSLGLFYWQFRHSPAALWRDRLRRRAADLAGRRADLRAPGRTGDGPARLADELFRRYLRALPLDALVECPGIGPGTLGRLTDAGLRSLADAVGYDFQRLPGIGPAKAADLRAGVRELTRQARGRFDAGACPEGQEYRRRVAAVEAEERARAAARQEELTAVEDALARVGELEELARDVTFWNYLFHRAVPGLTDEILNAPLPAARYEKPAPGVPVARPPVPAVPPVPVAPGALAVARPAALPVARAPSPALPQAVAPPAPTDLFRAELASPAAPAGSSPAHPLLPKLRAYARFMFAVARADGRVARAEKKVIRDYLGRAFGHDPVLARHIDPVMEQAEAAVLPEADAVAAVVAVTTAGEQSELLALAGRIVDASGDRNQREQDAINRIAAAFGQASPILPTSQAPAPLPPPPAPPAPDPRAVLEIEPGTELSPELIRRRYTLLSDKLDPAKAAALGPEFAAMAGGKRTKVRAAAEALIAPFGVPLDPPAAPPPPADLRHNPDLDDVFGA